MKSIRQKRQNRSKGLVNPQITPSDLVSAAGPRTASALAALAHYTLLV
jgi:hypothetical protein